MNTITIQKQAVSAASSTEGRYVSVTLPAPPWGSISIDEERKETDPGRRITLCSPYRPAAVKNAYTKIKRAIEEVREEAVWLGS